MSDNELDWDRLIEEAQADTEEERQDRWNELADRAHRALTILRGEKDISKHDAMELDAKWDWWQRKRVGPQFREAYECERKAEKLERRAAAK